MTTIVYEPVTHTVEVVKEVTKIVEVQTKGPQGIPGEPGEAGQGVPVGGLEGYVLRKTSDTDYDTEWAEAETPPAELGDLTDVVLTSPSTGEAFMFDGTEWINTSGTSLFRVDTGSYVIGDGNIFTADTDMVAIGSNTETLSFGAVAIGTNAKAQANQSFALGASSQSTAQAGVSIGALTSSAFWATAVGFLSNALANFSTAIGEQAVVAVGHDNSTAIGAGSNTTAANQIMMGRASETVSIPGDLEVTGTVTIDGYATEAQGILADSALQDSDDINAALLSGGAGSSAVFGGSVDATTIDSMVIGDSDLLSGRNKITAIGLNQSGHQSGCVMIGNETVATGANALLMGFQATGGVQSIALGYACDAGTFGGTAVGVAALGGGFGAMAIGFAADTSGGIGNNAIGTSATCEVGSSYQSMYGGSNQVVHHKFSGLMLKTNYPLLRLTSTTDQALGLLAANAAVTMTFDTVARKHDSTASAMRHFDSNPVAVVDGAINVVRGGWYSLKALVSTQGNMTDGANYEVYYSINGVDQLRGVGRSYTQGSTDNSGKTSIGFDTEVALADDDVVRLRVRAVDQGVTGITYNNIIAAETEFAITRITDI